jgi:hypothetical protein
MDTSDDAVTNIFSGGKKAKVPDPIAPPPTPPPAPTPQALDSSVAQKDRDRRRQRIAQAGRGGTILTQGQSLASGSATLLGRSNA